MVSGDHQAAGVGDAVADFQQPLVGGAQHRGNPLTLGVQGGSPGVLGDVLGGRTAQGRLHLLPEEVRQRMVPE